MNFLAHFHLAWPDVGLVAGALEGDYYKGPLRDDLPPAVARGVRLHRSIDAYTDGHPRLAALRVELPAGLRRYSGILLDLAFDHYLSRHWSRFSELPREQFIDDIHRALQRQQDVLSPGARRMLTRLTQYELLQRYTAWSTVTASAERIGERFTRGNPFAGIAGRLDPARTAIEAAFLDFYPDLQAFSRERITTLQ